jgi:hypothetical protein
MMQRHRQFDDAETCSQMTAGDRDGPDRFGPQFVGYLTQSGRIMAAQIFGGSNVFEHIASKDLVSLERRPSCRQAPARRMSAPPLTSQSH